MNSGIPEQIKQAVEAVLSNENDDAPLRSLTVSEMNRLRDSLLTALAPHFTQQPKGGDWMANVVAALSDCAAAGEITAADIHRALDRYAYSRGRKNSDEIAREIYTALTLPQYASLKMTSGEGVKDMYLKRIAVIIARNTPSLAEDSELLDWLAENGFVLRKMHLHGIGERWICRHSDDDSFNATHETSREAIRAARLNTEIKTK